MAAHLPIKSLVKLNWTISFMIALLFSILLQAITHSATDSLARFLEILVFMTGLSFANLALLSFFFKVDQLYTSRTKLKFYFASYLSATAIWLAVKTGYSLITGLKWEGEGVYVHQAYALAIFTVCLFNTLIILLQDFVILQHRKAKAEIENLQLKANVTETTNLLLRQQIHPHFLFNALTTIKSLYKKDFQQGEDYLVHLANFLRVSISNHTTKNTLIKNELGFCMDYLKMQKIRFGIALNYFIDIPEQTVQTKYLPFFSLQPLVENVLKHNDLTEERPILITIKEENGYLLIANNLQLRSYKEISTGQGLANLAERYRLLGKDEIVIKSNDSFFTVGIKILDK